MKFIDGHYEFSDYEKKEYKPVASQETVDKLNEYYQLKGTLKKEGGDNGGSEPVVQDPPKIKSNLSTAEQNELDALLDKLLKAPLNLEERKRKIALENKKNPK